MSTLTNPDGKHNAIYFPPGLPERKGSCAFASMRCLVNCLSYLTHNSVTDYTFKQFQEKGVEHIVSTVLQELESKEPKLLEWFCWGDCPPDMTEKVVSIMKSLSEKQIIQCGFTRNRKLWDEALKVKNIRLGYTTEDLDEIDELVKKGLVAYPNYDTGQTQLHYKTHRKRHFVSCGGDFITVHATEISYEAECSECYKNKRGCFTKFKLTPKPQEDK